MKPDFVLTVEDLIKSTFPRPRLKAGEITYAFFLEKWATVWFIRRLKPAYRTVLQELSQFHRPILEVRTRLERCLAPRFVDPFFDYVDHQMLKPMSSDDYIHWLHENKPDDVKDVADFDAFIKTCELLLSVHFNRCCAEEKIIRGTHFISSMLMMFCLCMTWFLIIHIGLALSFVPGVLILFYGLSIFLAGLTCAGHGHWNCPTLS